MKLSELRQKSVEELQSMLPELKGRLFNINFDAVDKKKKDSSQAKKIKKDIARVLTLIKENKSK